MDTPFINNNISISRKATDLCVSYILNPWLRDLNTDFALTSCFYESVELTNNAVLDKYKQQLQHRTCFSFRIFNYRWKRGKNTIISEVHLFILIITTGTKYPLNLTQSGKGFVLSLHFNGSKSFLFCKAPTFLVFQGAFNITHFVFQDLLKTSLRRVCKTSCNYIFKTSSRHLGRQKNVTLKTSSRRLQDVFSTSSPRRMFAGLFVNAMKMHQFKASL